MFNQLIESKSSRYEKKRIVKFLLTAGLTVICILSLGVVYSLFAYNLTLNGENLEFSSLLSPVTIPEKAPQPEKETSAEKRDSSQQNLNRLPSRKENIQRVDESPAQIPVNISTVSNQSKARPNSPYKISKIDSDGSVEVPSERERDGETKNETSFNRRPTAPENNKKDDDKEPTLPIIPKKETKPQEKAQTKPQMQTLGVINGKATTLVKPAYPASAKTLGIAGSVKVQVTIDEEGNVTSANVVNGHPLLSDVSRKAAMASKFSSTYLSNQKVKVTGFIIYNFVK